jgi:hypothetical protein
MTTSSLKNVPFLAGVSRLFMMVNMWHLNQQIFILPKEKGGLNDESGNLFPVEGHQTPLQTIYFLLRVAASCQ